MRTFATLRSQFWTGATGKDITSAGKDARIMATYLLTCEHANMIGLYRLPLLYASEETGLKRREVLAALEHLRSMEFARYDPETEFVWVYEMARFQLGLLPHEAVKEGDHRIQGAARLYKQLASNPFLLPFYEHYAQILRLPLKRDFLTEKKLLESPLGGASEPLIRGYVPVPDPDLLRKGDTGETKAALIPSSKLLSEKVRENQNTIPVSLEFEEFWKCYPMRNGKRVGKPEALRKWKHLDEEHRKLVLVAVRHYATSELVVKGIGIKDPHRWLHNGKNDEPWRDWIEPEQPIVKILNGHASTPTCTKRVPGPDGKLHTCAQPASPESRPTEPRCAAHATVQPLHMVTHACD